MWKDMNGAVVISCDTADQQTRDTWRPSVEARFADRPAVTLDDLPPVSLFIR
ncbi:MAG: hypothetical protein JNL43_00245 [Flavobacteriales bacterium]|nr:hypothetical protein [Flavobacteriales bacterium]